MLEHLPQELSEALARDRRRGRSPRRRLNLRVGEAVVPLLWLGANGFAIAAERGLVLRGLVDVYDGPRHLFQGLIMASAEADGVILYEFKRMSPAREAPPRDFAETASALDETPPSAEAPAFLPRPI